MASRLHQLEIAYQPEEDRLLLKIYTQDYKEISMWLTRRLVKSLWGGLNQIVNQLQENQDKRQQETDQVAKQFQKEQEQKQASAKQYSTKMTKQVLSESPILVTKVNANPLDKHSVQLAFTDAGGKHVELVANSKILLSLAKLISEAAQKAGWDLSFETEGGQ